MDYAAMNVVLSGIKSDLVREDLECASADVVEALADRGLVSESGSLAVVTESGELAFLEDDDLEVVDEDVSVFLNTAADTLVSEYEDITKADAEGLVADFIDEMVESGALPDFPDEGDAEAEGVFMSAAADMDFMAKLRGWLEAD